MIFPFISSTIFTSSVSNQTSLDHYKRLDYLRFPWKGWCHYTQKRNLDTCILNKVTALFQERYKLKDEKCFQKIWSEIGASIWTPSSPLTAGTLREIDRAFKSRLIYHGPGMEAPQRDQTTDPRVQNLIHVLMHGGQLSGDIVSYQAIQAIFVKKDRSLLKDFRKELQREFNHLALNPPKNPQEEVMWRAFFGNLIALLPFSYPPNGIETISLPLLSNGSCRQVEYNIEVIPLSLTSMASPMTAVGLTPKNTEDHADPILTFLGTTYPAGEGYAATLLADFTPGHSVGELVYDLNHEKIDQWMKGKKQVYVTGLSLGGAMSFHTLRHHHEQIARVDVYNPPGLYSWDKELVKECSINIYCQPGDIVSQLGYWPESPHVNLYTIMPHQDSIGENMISSHARAFTGCEKVTIIKQDLIQENRTFFRRVFTRLHQFLGPLLIFLPVSIMLALYYLFSRLRKRVISCCFKKTLKLK